MAKPSEAAVDEYDFQGNSIFNALEFLYPMDMNATGLSYKQVVWGDALMFAINTTNQTDFNAYFPNDDWYDIIN